jgi:hypothetical protein
MNRYGIGFCRGRPKGARPLPQALPLADLRGVIFQLSHGAARESRTPDPSITNHEIASSRA